MEVKIIENKKDLVEIEVDDKTLPSVLVEELNREGVDAYVYEKHPLFPGYRLRIKGDDAMKKLKKAISNAEDNWGEMRKEILKGVKGG
jgi:DNA-directed RNA polymerase subunit L